MEFLLLLVFVLLLVITLGVLKIMGYAKKSLEIIQALYYKYTTELDIKNVEFDGKKMGREIADMFNIKK